MKKEYKQSARRRSEFSVLFQRQQLVSTDVELISGLEGCCDNSVLRFDGEVDLVYRSEDLVDFANSGLVLKVYRCVEIRDLGVDRFADHLSLACVNERAHFYRPSALDFL